MTTEIVAGGVGDIDGVMAVMAGAFDPEYGEAWTSAQCIALLSIPSSQLLVARRNSEIAGFVLSRWVLDEEELLMIAVKPACQRLNIGDALLGAVIDNARVSGRKKLFLEVRDGNGAHRFYNASKFQEVGRRKNYYRGISGQTFDAISMLRMIE
jgi:[ribosomal protein S18]-alanine N-acetyltransferase